MAEYTDNSHLQMWEYKMCKINKKYSYEDDRFDITVLDRYTHVNIDSFSWEKKFETRFEHSEYTDGSKTKDGVGAGIVICRQIKWLQTESIHLPDEFYAEVMAIYEACQFLVANYAKYILKNQVHRQLSRPYTIHT